ncbi:MAG: hypothetical protein ACM3S3_03700 [Candidatus Doudnabacteria bacterium]
MKTLFTTVAIVATLIVALALAAPSGASERAPSCPDDIAIGNPNIADPWVLVDVGDPNQRLADRNREEVVCSATLRLFRRPVGRILTDNAIGDPTLFPPDPCTDPIRTVSIGDPNDFPWIRQIDLNGDGRICAGFVEPPDPDRTLILLDNPNVIAR